MDKEALAPRPVDKELERIPGAEPSARIEVGWWLLAAVIVAFLALVVLETETYLPILDFVLDGLWVTVYITLLSFLFTLVAGLLAALGRLSKNGLISGISTTYVELIRGIPLLVQLIWWYYAFPAVVKNLGRNLGVEALANYSANADAMAIMGLTVCYGAYMSEIYRAGIQSIPPGQMEAARSLGMNYLQAMRFVILPQAVRVILPPVGNEFIALLKDSSLVSAVAVAELTRRGREYMSRHFNPIEVWSLIALVYLVMTLFSARVVNRIEQNTRAMER